MSEVAFLGSEILGNDGGGHSGQITPPSTITGTISGNCSENVFVNGNKVAFIGSVTTESDSTDTGSGVVSGGSTVVFVNGRGISRVGDEISPHVGSAKIITGSNNVFSG